MPTRGLRFEAQDSPLEKSLNMVQGLANQFIAALTTRRAQLGREKEARMVDAYEYLLQNEDSKIAELETALNAVEDSIITRGGELINLPDAHRSVEAEELLMAAGEGAAEMVQVQIDDSRQYKEALEIRTRDALKLKRYIDKYEDALSILDPTAFGKDHIVEAGDVVVASKEFIKKHGEFSEEMKSVIEEAQLPSNLAKLQEDIFARKAAEIQNKITSQTASQIDANLRVQSLEPAKKEAQEAVIAMLGQGDTVSKLRESFAIPMIRRGEIDSGKDRATGDNLDNNEIAKKQEEIDLSLTRLGAILFPWIADPAASMQAAAGMEGIIFAASGISATGQRIPPTFHDLINKLTVFNAKYKEMPESEIINGTTVYPQARYKNDLFDLLGVDISNENWLAGLGKFNDLSFRIDIEQGQQLIELTRDLIPEYSFPQNDKENQDPDLEYYGLQR